MTKLETRAICQFTNSVYSRVKGVEENCIPIISELCSVSKSLHRLQETECNYGLTSRQESRGGSLEIIAGYLAKRLGAEAYIQSDPRGWPVYLLFPGDLQEGQSADSCYTNGVAVPPY